MILPSVVRSGRTPSRPCAPLGPTRKAMISSNTSIAPMRVAISRSRARNAGSAARTPPAPCTGSMMIAATSRSTGARIRSTPSASSHGSSTTRRETSSGTPGVQACTVSCVPWYEWSNRATSERPVKARAARIANIVASVPEFVNRSRSRDGRRPMTSSASSTSTSVGAANADARSTWRLHRVHDHRVRVSEDERRVVAEEVEVLVAVDVPGADALAADHVRRVGRAEHGGPGRPAGDRP